MTHNHRALAEQVYGIFTRGAVDELPQVFAADYVEHELLPGSTATGTAAVAEWVQMTTTGISGVNYRIDSVVGSGDEVCCRVQLTGKHTGELFGAPATGNDIDVMIIDWVRLDDEGKVVEHWGAFHESEFMSQIGIVPGAEATVDLTQRVAATT